MSLHFQLWTALWPLAMGLPVVFHSQWIIIIMKCTILKIPYLRMVHLILEFCQWKARPFNFHRLFLFLSGLGRLVGEPSMNPILLSLSSPFLHWPTFCLQNVYHIRYISFHWMWPETISDIISYYARMSVIQDLFIGQDQLTSHEAGGIWHIYVSINSHPPRPSALWDVSWSRRIYVIFYSPLVV